MKSRFSPLIVPAVFLLSGFISCSEKKKTLFTKLENTGIEFNNKVTDDSLENSFYYRNYYNGGGTGIGDINNDGLADVLLTSNMGENKLYLNKGNLQFEDITAKSGMRQDSMWSTGVMFVDINNDGWLDIYISNAGHMLNGNRRNKLYINNHDLSFTESAAAYGLDIKAYTTQVSFFDYDLDGDLDCFMINNSPMPINNLGYKNKRDLPDNQWPVAEFFKGGGDHLFRNDNNHFTEVTQQAGIHGTLVSFGLGVAVTDVNNDGWPDIFVSNDSYERDYLYINQGNGQFRDEMEDRIEQNSFSSMGVDAADINNDGYPDLFTTDMLPGDDYRLKTLGAFDNIDLYNTRIKNGLYRQFMKNCLLVNNKQGKFIESANYSGVEATDWSWGALFFDADNDGYNDIYVCNGINHDVTNLDFMEFFADDIIKRMVISGQKESIDSVLKHIPIYPMPNKAFRNNGNLRFTDMGEEWGFMEPTFSNGAAYGDLDNDGDLDLILNNQNQDAFIYRNNSRESGGGNYVSLELRGSGGNYFGIGTKIRVYGGGQVFYREQMPSRGFQSAVDYKQVIGVGGLTKIDSVELIWPDRSYTRYYDVQVNTVRRYSQPAQRGPLAYTEQPFAVLLQQDSTTLEAHREDDYTDYYYERNLPELLSREGPCMSVGDMNGDGLEDLFMGGAKGQSGSLYIQTKTGGWQKRGEPALEQYADFEDVASCMFDADGDGDLDLFVGAGGNYMTAGSRESQHRMYINDGQGGLQLDVQSFPNNDDNIAVAVSYDYDGDGDEDLFVGGRSVPYHYGSNPRSYVYNNDGHGHFKDVTAELNKGLERVGMVTGACWYDVTGDGKAELIVVGEWMEPQVYGYNKQTGKLERIKDTGLEGKYGWWQTVKAADLNGDGKADLVLGNMGENFYLRPDANRPVKLWLNDFDHTGTPDHFLTRSWEGRDVPVFLKREITDQFPFLKKENLLHSEYAKKDIVGLFGRELVEGSEQRMYNYTQSVIAWNQGGGKFRVEAMPVWVQLSSVNAVEFSDVNADGRADLVLGGNKFTFPPQFGRLDGSYGHVLLNEGDGKFSYMENRQTGLHVRGEVKAIRNVHIGTKNCMLFAVNDDKPMCYTIRNK